MQRWFYKGVTLDVCACVSKGGDRKIIAPIFHGCLWVKNVQDFSSSSSSLFFFLHRWQIVRPVNCETFKSYTSQTGTSLPAGVLSHLFLPFLPQPPNLQNYCRGMDCTPTLLYIKEMVLFSSPVADEPSAYEFIFLHQREWSLPFEKQQLVKCCHLELQYKQFTWNSFNMNYFSFLGAYIEM